MRRREGPNSLWGTRRVLDKAEALLKYVDSVFVLMIISLKISLHLFIYFVCITVCLWKQAVAVEGQVAVIGYLQFYLEIEFRSSDLAVSAFTH